MERRLWVALVALSLALPSAARAFDGPQVPDEVLWKVPEAVQDHWSRRQEGVAQMTREIDAARSALALQHSLDAVAAARRDLRATLTEATNLRVRARADLQAVQLARVDARIGLETAKLEERLAEDELRGVRKGRHRGVVRDARADRAEARDSRDEAARRLEGAREASGRIERAAEDRLAVADQAISTARQALNEVGSVSTGVGRRITGSELALLEAQRDLAAAQLEHDRAVGALSSGVRLRLRPYLDALEAARDAEGDAQAALR